MDRMRSKVLAAALVCAVAGALIGTPGASAASTASLEVVGKASLDSRGMNSALAVAGACAHVGSRAGCRAAGGVTFSNPAALRVTGALTRHAAAPHASCARSRPRTSWWCCPTTSAAAPTVSTCTADRRLQKPSVGRALRFRQPRPGHEFYLWQDPARPSRVLLYVSMFGASGDGLDVIDISDPARPVRSGGWAVPAAYGHAPLHSIDISADGRTAYVSPLTGGLVVADSSDFASGGSNPTLKPATPPSGVYKTLPGDVHSAVPLVGRSMVLTTDERYPSPYGQGCPSASATSLTFPTLPPRAIGTLAVPENAAFGLRRCRQGHLTSHNPTPHGPPWRWSAGIPPAQVSGLDDPANPQRLTGAPAERRHPGAEGPA